MLSSVRSFNSRAREGRDVQRTEDHREPSVSIHAPAKGATAEGWDVAQTNAFQFTRPRRARPRSPHPEGGLMGFNSRAREGRDAALWQSPRWLSVSIHAPAKGATRRRGRRPRDLLVSIHAPAKGATVGVAFLGVWAVFQFTRPRRARHGSVMAITPKGRVSIHAPAKGATDSAAADWPSTPVSIHAPAKGATRRFPIGILLDFLFQFTRPRRARQGLRGGAADARVSIHAPAKGATSVESFVGKDDGFQFTRPRRARRGHRARLLSLATSFNSRAREGRDVLALRQGLRRQVSIHAPAKGATKEQTLCDRPKCFNSRAREGRDGLAARGTAEMAVSIHAPAKGAT